jgi:hypothetical protein
MIKVKVILGVLLLFICLKLNAQHNSKYELKVKNACNFDMSMINKTVYGFSSDVEAESALQRIMKLSGLPANFEIRAASVPNAAAFVDCDINGNCKRYILYNQEFMENLKDETNSPHAEYAVLCHEIGHHLSGHTITNSGENYDLELEADKFAGFMLFKLGLTIEETKKTYSNLPINGSTTHPPKDARIAALTNGWYDAKRNGSSNTNSNSDKAKMPSFMYTANKIDYYKPTNNGQNEVTWVFDVTNNFPVGIDINGKSISITHFNSDYTIKKAETYRMYSGEPEYKDNYVRYTIFNPNGWSRSHEGLLLYGGWNNNIEIYKYSNRIVIDFETYTQPKDVNRNDRYYPGIDVTYLQRVIYYFDNK